MSGTRIAAVVHRLAYGLINSPIRLLALAFWPILDLVLWGLITTSLLRTGAELPVAVRLFLGGILLNGLVFHASNAVALPLIEENHSRNVISFMASPITPGEYLAGAVVFGLGRVLVTFTVLAALAWALFAFGVLDLGLMLATYATILIVFGIAVALVIIACVLRFGYAADELAFALVAILTPFAAVFYPIASLPGWAQTIAAVMPPAHVFEYMRGVLAHRGPASTGLWTAAVLDVLYLAGGFTFARSMFVRFLRRVDVTRYM